VRKQAADLSSLGRAWNTISAELESKPRIDFGRVLKRREPDLQSKKSGCDDSPRNEHGSPNPVCRFAKSESQWRLRRPVVRRNAGYVRGLQSS
jgi:hypothetical protein